MFILGVTLAVFIGITLGLLGGGGSILTVPLLLYGFRLSPEEAVTTSLLVVGVTSATALVSHAREGRVRWRTGLLFGAASMVGALFGGLGSSWLSPSALTLTFGAVMLVTALAMLRGRPAARPNTDPHGASMSLAKIAVHGVSVGAVTGLVGAGGGFLVVPALVLLGRLPMSAAVGTSLLVIALNSAAGLAGHLRHTMIPWAVAVPVVLAAVLGSLVGTQLTGRVRPEVLRRGFAWLVLAMAVVVLAQELSRHHPTA